MAEKVKGTDAMIKFSFHGSLEVYCYAKSFELAISTEMVGVSTIGDGIWKRVKGKRNSYTITMDALVLLSDTAPLSITPDFVEQQANLMDLPFEIAYTGEAGGFYSMSGRALIQNLSFSATPNAFISKNVQLVGNGPILRGDTPVTMVDLTMEVVFSPGTVTMEDVRIVDGIGNETVVHAGVIANGASVTASIQAGVYHIRATLNSDRPYNLFYSDADPGFSEPIGGPVTGLEYWPFPPDTPIWDFTVNRFLRWQGSDTPIA